MILGHGINNHKHGSNTFSNSACYLKVFSYPYAEKVKNSWVVGSFLIFDGIYWNCKKIEAQFFTFISSRAHLVKL